MVGMCGDASVGARPEPTHRARRRPTVQTHPFPLFASVYQSLYTSPMSRSATLPPIRIAPETKASVEAVLRKGETLTQFIENAVCREAEFRAEQDAAVARAKKALRGADQGAGLMAREDFLAGMERRAHAAQQRIRQAVEAKGKRAAE